MGFSFYHPQPPPETGGGILMVLDTSKLRKFPLLFQEGVGGGKKKMIHNIKRLKKHRRELRSGKTPAEAKLWKCLQRSQLGLKFRRQHSVGNYILDFYCPEKRLAIELDGDGHFNPLAEEYDTDRDAFLRRHGITVMRFENQRVFDDLDSILGSIKNFITP
jgi:very-short-patch-repair endonuclease